MVDGMRRWRSGGTRCFILEDLVAAGGKVNRSAYHEMQCQWHVVM